MKRLIYFIILFATIMLDSMAQTIGEAFYIYRNDGQLNAFFRDEVDSIAYSHYDLDSLYYEENVTQLIYTADSLYRIPLAVIDSVGFVTPETVYKEDAIQLTGELCDNIIAVDSLTILFSASTPANLLPKVGDKLATVELTDFFPCGFSGKVMEVLTADDGTIKVICEPIDLKEAVSRFYGVAEIVSLSEGNVRRYRIQQRHTTPTMRLPIPEIHVQLDVSANILYLTDVSEYAPFSIDETIKIDIVPTVTGKITYVIDDKLFFGKWDDYNEIHIDTDLKIDIGIDIGGSIIKDFKLPLISKDFQLWGVPVYIEFGPRCELGGQLMIGTNIHGHFHSTTDINYYPQSVGLALIAPEFLNINKVKTKIKDRSLNLDWRYFSYKGAIKIENYFRVGVPFTKHEVAWAGVEGILGRKIEGNFYIDFKELKNASTSTTMYETLKDIGIYSEQVFWSAKGVISGFDDNLMWSVGTGDIGVGNKWERGILPLFRDTKLDNTSGRSNSLNASVSMNRDCLLPVGVGFAVHDEEGNQVQKPQYYDTNFRLKKDLPAYGMSFGNLDFDKKYTAYPLVRLFGFDMLASPTAEKGTKPFPVTLSDFKVTKCTYKEDGFHNDGIDYDYCFNVSVTATLAEGEEVEDWGYVYRDPNGREKEISLMEHGNYYVDNDYAYYRDDPHSSVCLFGYVKYAEDADKRYMQDTDYDVDYENCVCPDDNHPHMTDLGLPSGTKWACCNVGARAPEEFGNYYMWGETIDKTDCYWDKYIYWQDINGNGYFDYNDEEIIDIGTDISGTQYDVAHVLWGDEWRMATVDQWQELVDNTISEYVTQNGVPGRVFTGPNGASIFLPSAGYYGLGGHTSSNIYWSSTLSPSNRYEAYLLQFWPSMLNIRVGHRDCGQPIRPVRMD